MDKKKYHNSPEYFVAIMFVAVIAFLTSLSLIYSCIKHGSYVNLAAGIVGLIFGIIGLIEFFSKKRILPHRTTHWLREIVALILLAWAVYIIIAGSVSMSLNFREKLVAIILFTIGFHALHLRGFIKKE